MTPDNTRELIAEAEQWAERALPTSPWGEKHVVHRLTVALAALTTPQEAKSAAKVVPVSYEASASCSHGVCPSGCSHLMWACSACSCEGGWGASKERLEELAAEHVCVAVTATPQEGDARERIAREAYRELYPGPINTPDSNRTRESDLAEMDSAYAIWDGGHEGFAPGIICRRVADRILAAFPVLSRAAPAEPPHIPYPGEPFDPRHAHDWADNACQSPGCMARPDGTTQTLSVRRTRKGS